MFNLKFSCTDSKVMQRNTNTKISHLLVYSWNTCSWRWARLKSGSETSDQVPCWGGRDLSMGGFTCCLAGWHQQEARIRRTPEWEHLKQRQRYDAKCLCSVQIKECLFRNQDVPSIVNGKGIGPWVLHSRPLQSYRRQEMWITHNIDPNPCHKQLEAPEFRGGKSRHGLRSLGTS